MLQYQYIEYKGKINIVTDFEKELKIFYFISSYFYENFNSYFVLI